MSNYRIYAGNKKALVFPIMGDGYVHLDYSKHIPKGPDVTYVENAMGDAQNNAGIEIDETADDERDPCDRPFGHRRRSVFGRHRLHLAAPFGDLFLDPDARLCADVLQPRLLGADPGHQR